MSEEEIEKQETEESPPEDEKEKEEPPKEEPEAIPEEPKSPEIPENLSNPKQVVTEGPKPDELVNVVMNKYMKSLKDDVSKNIAPMETRINTISDRINKVFTHHQKVLENFKDFKKKTADWQSMVKKISTKDLQKIKSLRSQLAEKDSHITTLKSALEKKEETIRQQVVSETTPALPQTYEDLHPKLLKRVEFPEQNLIYWAVGTSKDSNNNSVNEIKFFEEEEIYFEDVTNKTGLRITDEELLTQSKLNLQKAVRACKESDEQLKSYKARAHQALKKKNEHLEELKEEIRGKEDELLKLKKSGEVENEEKENLNMEIEERMREIVNVQEELLILKKEKISLDSENQKQKDLLEKWENKFLKNEEKSAQEIQQMEEEFQSQLGSQKTNWLNRLNEKEKIIMDLRKQINNNKKSTKSLQQLHQSDNEENGERKRKIPNIEKLSRQQESMSQGKKTKSANEGGRKVKKEFEEIFALAEIQAKREREIKEKNRKINELKMRLKKYHLLDKDYNKLSKTYQKQSKTLEDVYKKENIPNLEYLKNITIQLLLCDDKPVKKNFLKVISQMLKFEKLEYSKCYKKLINPKSKGIFGF